MSYSAHQYQLRELAAQVSPRSRYRTIYPQLSTRYQQASNLQGCDIFGHRLRTVPFAPVTTHGVPTHISSALAAWSIPPENWIHYYNGTYAWPTGLAIPDPRISRLEQSFVPTMSFLPQFASNTATSPHPVHNNQFSRVFSGRLRRAPGSHSFSLRDQYGIRSPLGPFGSRYTQSDGSNSASYDSSSHTSLEFFEEDICPPPGFDDPKSIEEQLTDLRAIVNFIVPAGGEDPNVNHGPAFERLKFSPGDDNEVIEHFVRNAEAQDPDFKDKLAEFSNDRPDMFRGASPTDDWRKQEMYMSGCVEHQGEWMRLVI
ncbi:hypothetical protein ONS95_010135 [Cadophora gregata]|uniref:uncharacterized protein n=1 Tax=Cadophora gregata TaxID=51156 RepID=UPI0026DDAA3A|nr:uncharacterized protein ONS95_010135 [Cadophora gregata]KAK0121856.1 hypothetical protein ONS95_010135 [Cadophora gregata]